MASLSIRNMTKRFGDLIAVNNMNLDIADQEFMVLLGPTGAGKTTTLRCVAGLERLEEGEVYIDDRLVNDDAPADRDVAFVFQSYALYPNKTAFANMASPLEARRWSKADIEQRVQEVSRVLHIEHLLGRKPQQLSGGEQQRVALGRAMVRRPKIFFMDEPLTNLDFKLRVAMRTELKRLHRGLNTTFFYVTNDQVEAMTMADRVAVLNLGRLQQIGTPTEVYDHPANLFVASFIGSPTMNLLPCALLSEGANADFGHGFHGLDHGGSALRGAGGTWQMPISDKVRDRIRQGTGNEEELIMGIRPEDISLSTEVSPGAIEAEIYAVEPLGDRNIFDLRLSESIVKVKTPPTFFLEMGTKVWMTVDQDRMHIFEKESEKIIF